MKKHIKLKADSDAIYDKAIAEVIRLLKEKGDSIIEFTKTKYLNEKEDGVNFLKLKSFDLDDECVYIENTFTDDEDYYHISELEPKLILWVLKQVEENTYFAVKY
jgi:hypothetical protein